MLGNPEVPGAIYFFIPFNLVIISIDIYNWLGGFISLSPRMLMQKMSWMRSLNRSRRLVRKWSLYGSLYRNIRNFFKIFFKNF
jgi:hypothetical protein